MSIMAFHRLFPHIAEMETRSLTLYPLSDPTKVRDVPNGLYSFLESYCVDPRCDCRRVLISVFADTQRRVVATISHSFEWPGRDDVTPEQTFLDSLNPQSQYSQALLRLFLEGVLDPGYAARLVRHYTIVKVAVVDPKNPIHRRIAELTQTHEGDGNAKRRKQKKRWR